MMVVHNPTPEATVNGRTIISIAVGAALLAPAASLASLTTERVGSLEATGTGTIVARGNLTAFGRIEGTVLVRDRHGRAVVRINGVRQRPKTVGTGVNAVRVYTIRRASGAFYAQGKNVRIELRSPANDLSVTMFGRGAVTQMTGEGTFKLNAGEEEQWVNAAVPLQIRPAPPRKQSSIQALVESSGVRL
jgi:hypothetical protein